MSDTRRFIDLHDETMKLKAKTTPERVIELAGNLPRVSLCAIGGIPFKQLSGDPFLLWNGLPVNVDVLKHSLLEALGLSAVLTYVNKGEHDRLSLGQLCVDRNEGWAYHWISASIVLAGHSPSVQLAFARDTRFRLSWTVEKKYTGKVFMATAGIHEWLKFSSKKNDPSFDADTRDAMDDCHRLLREILP